MARQYGWITLLLAVCALREAAANKTTEITIRVGASVGSGGPCALLYNQTALGYSFFFDLLSKLPPQEARDIAGDLYLIRFSYRLATHDCTEPGRAAALTSLINGTQPGAASPGSPAQPPVHFLLGGNGINAMEDALQADAAERILIHCCTARDSVYILDLPHVYGLFTPASMYTDAVLRTMAFSGVQRLAVVGTSDSALHLQLCAGAVRQLPALGKLRPGFGAVAVINYTVAEASAPGFWDAAAARLQAAQADALVGCDELERTSQLVRRLAERGHALSAVWLASYGNASDFVTYAGAAAQYALTTVQWAPGLPYADPLFGTAGDYAVGFRAATGAEPSYFSAAASSAGYVLLNALTRAISRCDLTNVTLGGGDPADSFLWRRGVLACYEQSRGVQYGGDATGQMLVQQQLSTMHLDTVFGPVGFNSYRQNIYHPVIVTQVLGERLEVVIPLDLASARLVLPIPGPQRPAAAWTRRAAGIVIIALACCLAAVCLALAAAMAHRWLRPRLSLAVEVEVDPAEIRVDLSPVRNVDGTFEAGEGTYRGTRVKLEVAAELLAPLASPPLPPLPTSKLPSPMPPLSKSPSPMPMLPTQRSRLNAHTASMNGAVPVDESGASPPQARPSLKDILVRRPSEAEPQPLTPRQSAKSQSGMQAFGGSKRSRRQVSVLVWRALRLRHPCICPIVGIVWEWPGLYDNGVPVPVIVRQWYELGSLAQLQENETVNLPLLTKAAIVQGVAEGLAYLHAQEPPILAGPLAAHRILIDKNFTPHLFLRLTSLDTAGPGAAAAAAAAADAPSPTESGYVAPPRGRARSEAGGGAGTSCSGALVVNVSPSPVRTPQRSLAKPAHVVLVDAAASDAEVGGGAAAAAGLDVERPSLRTAATAELMATGAAAQPSGFLAAAAAAAAATYAPSKAQDVLEFGRLLGSVFVAALESSNSKLLALQGSHGADSGDFRRYASGALGSGNGGTGPALMRERSTWLANDDASGDAAMLQALAEVCVPLAELARACLEPDPGARPSMADVVAALDGGVREALTHALGHAAHAPAAGSGHAAPGGGGGGGADARNSGGGVPPRALFAAESVAAAAKGGVLVGGMREGSFVALGTAGAARRRSLMLGATAAAAAAHAIHAGHLGHVAPLRLRSGSFRKGHAADGGAGWSAVQQEPVARVIGHTVDPDDLLFEIFPPKVANALRAGETVQPERYECVSIFFSDVVGYTDLCAQLQPYEVMDLMHRLYSLFDGLCQAQQLFKVETVGDAYLAVGNLRWPQPDSHARLVAQFALDAIRAANSLTVHPERPELGCVRIRVGLHCGPVVGSVVGTLNRRYCLFGDAVNTAARMEHNSEADRVHCSSAFAAVLAEQWPEVLLVSRGVRHIKGKGQMETYWLEERTQAQQSAGGKGWYGAGSLAHYGGGRAGDDKVWPPRGC